MTKPSTYKPWRIAAALGLTLACTQSVRAADAPALLGQMVLGAAPRSLSVTPDGTRVLIETQPVPGESAQIQLIDTSDPRHPRALGTPVAVTAGISADAALSDDGRHALLVERRNVRSSVAPGNFVVTALDLSDPDHPRTAWDRPVQATSVALAPDATGFVYQHDGQLPFPTYTVRLGHADGTEEEGPNLGYMSASVQLWLSAQSRFVVANAYGAVVEASANGLARQPALLKGAPIDNCLVAVASTGYLLVEDLRAPRFGIYAPELDLPRVAKLSHDAGLRRECQFVRRGQARDRWLLQDAGGFLYTLDMSDARRPRLSKPLLLPPGTSAAGLDSRGRIYALRRAPDGLHLEILDTARPVRPVVDWVALERVHQEVLRMGRDGSAEAFQFRWDAASKFEEAASIGVLGAPVVGISNKTAAALLNDYAWLLGKAKAAYRPDLRPVLRRAIQLDPELRDAYLQLAEASRQALLTQSGPREAALAEARTSYRTYVSLGGAPVKALQALMSDPLEHRPRGDMCGTIVAFANAGRLDELIRSVAVDVPVGGRKLDFGFTTAGTAHVPVMQAWEAGDDRPAEVVQDASPGLLWGGDQLGLVMYGGEAHILHYRDAAHPVASRAVSGAQTCNFETETVERPGRDAIEPQLCKHLAEDGGPEPLDLSDPTLVKPEDVAEAYPVTEQTAAGKLDLFNDGAPVNLAQLHLVSGAGPGCEETFFDLLDADGTRLVTGPRHDQVMSLQGALVPGTRYPVQPCANSPRFFSYKDRVYFETKPTDWPPRDEWDTYHRVTRIRQGHVEEVCHFTFASTVKLASTRPDNAVPKVR